MPFWKPLFHTVKWLATRGRNIFKPKIKFKKRKNYTLKNSICKRFNNMSHWMDGGRWVYTHSSICFAASYSVVLQIGGVAPRIKIHLLNPSIDKCVRIFRQLEQVFQRKPNNFQWVEGKGQLSGQCPYRENKHNTASIKTLFEKGFLIIRGFVFSRGVLEPNVPTENEGWFHSSSWSIKKKFNWIVFQHRLTASSRFVTITVCSCLNRCVRMI